MPPSPVSATPSGTYASWRQVSGTATGITSADAGSMVILAGCDVPDLAPMLHAQGDFRPGACARPLRSKIRRSACPTTPTKRTKWRPGTSWGRRTARRPTDQATDEKVYPQPKLPYEGRFIPTCACRQSRFGANQCRAFL
jgi:hypothetical protein